MRLGSILFEFRNQFKIQYDTTTFNNIQFKIVLKFF